MAQAYANAKEKAPPSPSHLPKQTENFRHPRYWLTWLGLGFLRLVTLLPWSLQRGTARFLGWLLYHLAKRRCSIAKTNIEMCFQALHRGAQKQLLKDTLYENALGIVETGHALWSSDTLLQGIASFHGSEALQGALEEGKGVILVGAHYTTLDLGGRLFSQFFPVDTLYRPHKNKLLDSVLLKSRSNWSANIIDNKSLRQIVKSLKSNHIFWYPADQDYGPEHAVFAPFFGIPAATLNTTARLAELTGAAVFVLGYHRNDNHFTYEINVKRIQPPTGDVLAFTTEVNAHLEQEIRRYPAQYMWVHRRFKTRPATMDYPYER